MVPSKFILGTVQFGVNYGINNTVGQPEISTVFQIFNEAQKSGIIFLDTAKVYGAAHEIIGKYHNGNPNAPKFKVNTKFDSIAKDLLISEVDHACKTLAIDRIDTCFYHNFIDYKNKSLFFQFDELISRGLIKNIGVSIYSNEEFEDVIIDPNVTVIQLPFNPFDNFSQRGHLIRQAKKAGKLIQVRSIFLQGLFFMDPWRLKGNIAAMKNELIELNAIANELGIPISDLCIQYALHYEEIDNVIIGVDTHNHLISNVKIGKSTLSSEIIDRINAIYVKNKSLLYPYNWK